MGNFDWGNHDTFFNNYIEDNNVEFIDTQKKEIGDRISVLDYSSMSYLDGEAPYSEDYDKFINDNYFIVIETGLKFQYRNRFKKYLQNIIIVNPKTNKQYRISSSYVKVIPRERNLFN